MAIAADLGDTLAPPDRTASRLIAQEQHILALAATGWSHAAVAESLGLTPEAVGGSLASIIEKVGARSKIEAVLIAVRNGLIDLPTETAGELEDGQRASHVRPVMRLLRWGEADPRVVVPSLDLPMAVIRPWPILHHRHSDPIPGEDEDGSRRG